MFSLAIPFVLYTHPHGWAPNWNVDPLIHSGSRQVERHRASVRCREASRKWEWALLQTVWGVVEGRMLIKIINNCWSESGLPHYCRISCRSWLRLPAPAANCKGGHKIRCWNFSPDRWNNFSNNLVLLHWQHPLGIAWPREKDWN